MSINEAVDIILSQMEEPTKQSLRAKKRDGLIEQHFGWGMNICKAFGL